MNSYMRQTTPIPADQMHSFLKDKQAWENAIAMYQGPDALDHWYNYVCWYENHGHGDPENKYRETLERCLTLYEHSDYYKQDPRMVRLWIKYIDMQPNPLHFYQVLHKRGVGRQVAAFYISWAGYYESIHALKEAESVYNLGFQEKAQSYAELHHAHSKLMYARQAAAAASQVQQLKPAPPPAPAQQQQQLQQQLQQQQQQLHYQQQQHAQVQLQMQPPAPQMQVYRQQVSFQQPPQSQLHMPIQKLQQQQQQQIYQQQQMYQQHANYQQLQQQTQHVVANEIDDAAVGSAANYMQPSCSVQVPQAPPATVPIEQQLPAAVVEHYSTQTQPAAPIVNAGEFSQQQQRQQVQIMEIAGIKLPRKFAAYCRNNYETWRPALFLEEPDDPSRHCHYAKNLVYPAGINTEYSPEELRGSKFGVRLQSAEVAQPINAVVVTDENSVQVQQFQEIGSVQQTTEPQCYTQQQQQQQRDQPQQHNYYHAVTASEPTTANNVYETAKDQYQNEEEAEEDEEEDDDEDDEDDEDNYTQQQPPQQQQQQDINTVVDLEEQIQASTIRFSMHSTAATTTTATQQSSQHNKTIKIKFKKERQPGNDSLNGSSNYSAYTVESIYQQEVASPTTAGQAEQTVRRNGYSFHPYMLGQTSTPKTNTSSKRSSKPKVKRVNKFHAIACGGSSNSSSADTANGAALASVGVGAVGLQQLNNNNNRVVVHNATFNDNANYSFSSAAALDNSNCSISSAVGRLNFRDATAIAANSSAVAAAGNVADFSTYQENSYFATQHDAEAKERRLQKALETIDRHLAKEAIDPFSSELCRAFLTKLDFPGGEDDHANYKIIQWPLPKIANTRTLSLPDGLHFSIDKEVGRGSYGSVYKATNINTGDVVALKFQKPPNTWEIYICDQVLKRIQSPNVLPGLMDISTAIIAPNASLIATEFSPFGSLLDINNKIRQATTKVMHESLVMHFSSQICSIIHHLHLNKIIHADIKPDNFLLMRIPSTDLHFPSLRLIDFGCAIDMTLFPDSDNTKFRKVIQTDGFTCIEMQEGRPWSYETDLFCIAGTVHVMLLGEYMQLQKRAGSWDIKQKLPRYLKKHVWTKFFGEMLNVKSNIFPDLNEMRDIFQEEAAKMDSELQSQIRTLSNILYRR